MRRSFSPVHLAETRGSNVRNARLFREVNGRIAELPSSEDLILLCECGSAECLEQIEISRQAYEAVGRSDLRFVVAPSHSDDEVEALISVEEGYVVVEKLDDAA